MLGSLLLMVVLGTAAGAEPVEPASPAPPWSLRLGLGMALEDPRPAGSLNIELEARPALAAGLRLEALPGEIEIFPSANLDLVVRIGPTVAWRPGRQGAYSRPTLGGFVGMGRSPYTRDFEISPHLVVGFVAHQRAATVGLQALGWVDNHGGSGAIGELIVGLRIDPSQPEEPWVPADGSPPLPVSPSEPLH